jgi:hypothetical protein
VNRNVLTTPIEFFVGALDADAVIGSFPAVSMADGASIDVYTYLLIPSNFQTFVKAEALVVAGGTGNMRRSVDTTWGNVGTETYNSASDSIAAGEVAVTTNLINAVDISAAFTGVAAGDLVGIKFNRGGNHANDTVGAVCYFIGVRLQYV